MVGDFSVMYFPSLALPFSLALGKILSVIIHYCWMYSNFWKRRI
jgi:hypothetical protein